MFNMIKEKAKIRLKIHLIGIFLSRINLKIGQVYFLQHITNILFLYFFKIETAIYC